MASPAGAGAGAGGAHFHLPHLQLPHLLQLPFGKHSSRRTTTTRARAGGGFAPPKLTTDFSGRWHKDAARSSPMTDALRVMAIGGVVRQAIKLVRGCEIKQTPDMFEMAVTSALPWFKVTERYPLDGAEIKLRRRDLRGGGAVGAAVPVAPDRLELRLSFGGQHPGTNVDTFSLAQGGEELVVETRVTNGSTGEEATFTQIYSRRK